jgi:hypothetical protein
MDRLAESILHCYLPAVTASLCLLMLATWVPHYLVWPWWPDLDTNAAMALGWSRGELPYRDVTAFAFPGQIYLFRGLIAASGPGRTWPIYALDAAMVAGLGLMMVLWSRRRFGSSWPGLVGAAGLIAHHAGLNFSLVAQRDWQATALVCFGLLASTTWPGRAGLVASALATAAALAFRPHVIVFFPALIAAVIVPEGGRKGIRAALSWGLLVATGMALAFLPLIAQGIFDDFLRGVRLAGYGGGYSRATPGGMVAGVVRQATEFRWVALPMIVLLLGGSASGAIRREARVWLLAALGVLLYKPLHPFPHDYLDHPRWVVWSVLLGLAAAAIMGRSGLSSRIRLAAAVGLLAAAVPEKPMYCNPRAALSAILGKGHVPPGYAHHMTAYQAGLYPWDDYRRAVEFLRDELGPETRVANLLGYQLATIGASGRLPVFRNESGLLWKSQVGWEDRVYLEQLEAEVDSVVVWAPDDEGPEPGLVSAPLIDLVRRRYEPAARFGVIEVRRRRPEQGQENRPR